MITNQIKSIRKSRWLFLILFSIAFAIIQLTGTNDWKALKIDNLLYYFAPTDQSSGINGFFLYALPLVSMILSGNLWAKEKHSRRLNYDFIRVNHQQFIKTTFINSFLLGGISVLFPLIFNLLGALPKCHHFNSSVAMAGDWGFNVTNQFWAGNFFDIHPIYALIFVLFIYALYGGIFSCMGMLACFFIQYKYSEYLFPFLLNFVYVLVTSLIGMEDWNPAFYLNFSTAQSTSSTGISLLVVTLILLGGIFIGYRKMVQHDILD